jgi:hypothetical protein
MNKGFIYGAALAFSVASGGVAMAKSQAQTPTSFIKGTYNCQLTGGFIAQAASSGLAQFTVDGKGNVTSTAGEFNVSVGAYSLPNSNNTDANFLFPAQYIYQTCDYTPGTGGTYSIDATGGGTISVNWSPNAGNPSSGTDCSEDITTNFDIVVNSPASFILTSTDILNGDDCTTGSVNYASCGSSFTGTCVQQSAKP